MEKFLSSTFSPCKEYYIGCTSKGWIYIIKLQNFSIIVNQIYNLKKYKQNIEKPIYSICFVNENVFCIGTINEIKFWNWGIFLKNYNKNDLEDLNCIGNFETNSEVNSLLFTVIIKLNKNNKLFSGEGSGEIRVFDINQLKEIKKIKTESMIYKLGVMKNSLISSGEKFCFWNEKFELIQEISPFKNKNMPYSWDFSLSQNDDFLCIGGECSYNTLWSTKKMDLVYILPTFSYTHSVQFFNDEIYIAGTNNLVNVWSLDGCLNRTNNTKINSIYNINFLNDASYITSGIGNCICFTNSINNYINW
jgi:WD40 repeat protein